MSLRVEWIIDKHETVVVDEEELRLCDLAAFLGPAVAYRNLGFCPSSGVSTRPCANRAVVKQLITQNQIVNAAIANLQAQVASGNTTGATAALTVLQNAVAAAELTAANYGVH